MGRPATRQCRWEGCRKNPAAKGNLYCDDHRGGKDRTKETDYARPVDLAQGKYAGMSDDELCMAVAREVAMMEDAPPGARVQAVAQIRKNIQELPDASAEAKPFNLSKATMRENAERLGVELT